MPTILASAGGSADVLLSDGTIAAIRPLTDSDRAEVLALHNGVSDESVRYRFFSLSRGTGEAYLRGLFPREATAGDALVATVRGRLVALASAEPTEPGAAEVAFLVSDSEHHHGLGSLLLEHLAARGRAHGLTRFVAEVLPDNAAMLRVFMDIGFTVRRRTEDSVVHVEIDLVGLNAAVEAADTREAVAEARSLQPLLHPRTVALVGVRRASGGIGRAVLGAVLEGGYTGRVFVVHPRPDEVAGLDDVPVVDSLTSIPVDVDLLVVAVPAAQVPDALRDAARAGVRAAVVISSGFSELGEHGRELQRESARIARENSIRLVGPNCLGVLCNSPETRLNATFGRNVPPYGGLAVASQSGGVGIALLDLAAAAGLGVHSFVSLGNKADVSSNDLLSAWIDDDTVSGAALYLESFGNAVKFSRLARRFAERKPLLAVSGGRSEGGRRAGASHTAAAATPAVGVDAMFTQSGVIRCSTAEELAETALLLAEQPLPPGHRVGVVSNAGGMGVVAADLAESAGLVLPQLSEKLNDAVAALVSGTLGTGNPVDLGAGVGAAELETCVGTLLDSDEVDAVLVLLVATRMSRPDEMLAAVSAAGRNHPTKPLLLVATGDLDRPVDPSAGTVGRPTRFSTPAAAVGALGRVAWYADWRRTPREPVGEPDVQRGRDARALAQELLGEPGRGAGWLSAEESSRLLTSYGIAMTGLLAHSAQEAADQADSIGYPVVVKAADGETVHRTEQGLVRVGVGSAAEVATVVKSFEVTRGGPVTVAVQPLVKGVELGLGIVRDPGFGPLVMVAAGGVTTNILDDRSFLVPPLTRRDAARALRSLRVWPLLEGYRGGAPADVASLENLVVELGWLAGDVPAIAELDLNPVLVTPAGVHCVDVKVRLAEGTALDAGFPRRLRDLP